jgi:hypothetical protein
VHVLIDNGASGSDIVKGEESTFDKNKVRRFDLKKDNEKDKSTLGTVETKLELELQDFEVG